MSDNTPDLRTLRAQLLQAEIRKTEALAAIEELKLASARDVERDRLAKGGFNRVLNFFGPVGGDFADEAIGILDHWRRRDPGQPVEVNINSPGGSVVDGFALFDAIQRLRREGATVTTRATGAAMSMGALLLQAGDIRIMDENAFLMIHEVASSVSGKRSDIADVTNLMDKMEDRALKILTERSTMSRAQIARRWKRADWYLGAEEALKLGFVDRVE